MENASRALIMAATTILAIMLLSIFVYVFMRGARASQAVEEEKLKNQLMEQNAEFERYNKDTNTFSDVISLVNLIYNYNTERDYDPNDCITLEVDLGSGRNLVIDSSIGKGQRNKIKYNGALVSVYDIARSEDIIDTPNSTLSQTTYDLNKGTIYRYYFKVNNKNTDWVYDMEEGDLKSIKLTKYAPNEDYF